MKKLLFVVLVFMLSSCKSVNILTNILEKHIFFESAEINIYLPSSIETFSAKSDSQSSMKMFEIISKVNDKVFVPIGNQVGDEIYKIKIKSENGDLSFSMTKFCGVTCSYVLYYFLEDDLFLAQSDAVEIHILISSLLAGRGIFVNDYVEVSSFDDYTLHMVTIPMINPRDNDTFLGIESAHPQLIGGVCNVLAEDQNCTYYFEYSYFTYNRDYIQLKYFITYGAQIIGFHDVSEMIPIEILKILIDKDSTDFISIIEEKIIYEDEDNAE